MNRLYLLIPLLFCLIIIPNSQAVTYCVNQTGGSDANPGTCASPFATINKLVSTWSANDEGFIAPGVYNETPNALNAIYINDANTRLVGSPALQAIITVNGSTCSRILDLDANNITVDGLYLRGSSFNDTCEAGILLRETKNDSKIMNSVLQNFTTIGIDIATSGTTIAHNNPVIWNNTFLQVDTLIIDISAGFSNNTNISRNTINVGVTNSDTGIGGTQTVNIPPAFNWVIADNVFNYTFTVASSATAIFLSPGNLSRGPINAQIVNNTFGNPTVKWRGNLLRTRLVTGVNFSNNTGWFNGSSHTVHAEFNTSGITIDNNRFCSPTDRCSTFASFLNIENANNSIIRNNTAYMNTTDDGIFSKSTYADVENITIQGNYIDISEISELAHAIGAGGESNVPIARHVTISDNIINLTGSNSSSNSHVYFFGSVYNGTAFNNTAVNGRYGMIVKYSINVTVENHTVYNATLLGLYDKGSNHTIWRYNTIYALNNGTYVAQADGSAPFISQNVSFYNNTYIMSGTNQTIGLSLILQQATRSDNNTYYLPYRSYNRTFQNGSTTYNYRQFQQLFNMENNSRFFPIDSLVLNAPANNSFYNGITYNWTPNLTGIGYANATFYMNFSNGTSYINQSNGSAILNNLLNLYTAFVNVSSAFTWTVCFNDTNAFQTCGSRFTVNWANTSITINFTSPANGTAFNGNTTFNFTVNTSTVGPPLSTCWYNVDGGVNVTYTCNITQNLSTSALAHGIHNITAYANDTLGGVNSGLFIFYVDRFPPVILVNRPLNNSVQPNNVVLLNTTVTDNLTSVSSCWFNLNNQGNTTYNCSTVQVLANSGTNIVIFYANDTVGNLNSTTILFNTNASIYCTYEYQQVLTNITLTGENKVVSYKDEPYGLNGVYLLLLWTFAILTMLGGVYTTFSGSDDSVSEY